MHKDLHNIDVPKEEVFAAIQSGIQQGQLLEKKVKRKKTTKRIGILSSAAAALLLASGFVFTPVSNVLAQVPLIGGIYEKYHMSIGEQLASEQLLTEMSLVANDQNIQVEISQNNELNITFDDIEVGQTNAKISYKANFESTIEGQFYTFEAYNMHQAPKDTTSIKIVPILKVHDVTTEQLESITIKLN